MAQTFLEGAGHPLDPPEIVLGLRCFPLIVRWVDPGFDQDTLEGGCMRRVPCWGQFLEKCLQL